MRTELGLSSATGISMASRRAPPALKPCGMHAEGCSGPRARCYT